MADVLEVRGLQSLIRELKGPAFRDVNRALRAESKAIALEMLPEIVAAVKASNAPQAEAVSKTVRVHSDRVPVVVVGKTNPWGGRKWRRAGQGAKASKLRRGSIAHGVVYGPKGGRRPDGAAYAGSENYYRTSRDETGGPLGRALMGPLRDKAAMAYLAAYERVLTEHGFARRGGKMHWLGRGR